MTKKEESRIKLLEQFFKIGGSIKNISKSKSLEKKINNHFKNTKDSDEQLLDALRLLKVYIEDYDFYDFEETHRIAAPVIHRLSYKIDWDLYDIGFAQAVITYAKDFEESELLANRALHSLEKYIEDGKPFFKAKASIRLNLLSRALRADFVEIDPTIQLDLSKKVKAVFENSLDAILSICKGKVKDEDFRTYELMALIRSAIFDRDSEAIVANLDLLKEAEDKQTYKMMKEEVVNYSSYSSFAFTQKQLSILCGANIKELRAELGFNSETFAAHVGLSKAYFNLIELGERNAPVFMLIKIANALGVTLDELCYGKNRKKAPINKKEIVYEKIRARSVDLDEDGLEMVYQTMDFIVKYGMKMKKRPYVLNVTPEDDLLES
ncbi:MAG: helix-turn-helix domain-containing protein [Defluviitaleaceae bacterium]|nr:helix-turn-helix domain-containing protein [Defluviitaleaceae bacterium]